jgi:hypothetical protein
LVSQDRRHLFVTPWYHSFIPKDLYGINEAKIQAYSPSEAQKIYERPVNRKANARFNPAATVEIIRMGEPTAANLLDEEGRRDLVAKYLGVSHPKYNLFDLYFILGKPNFCGRI